MLKTGAQIRWSSACDMFIAESVYLVVNSFTCHSVTHSFMCFMQS